MVSIVQYLDVPNNISGHLAIKARPLYFNTEQYLTILDITLQYWTTLDNIKNNWTILGYAMEYQAILGRIIQYLNVPNNLSSHSNT